jgi:hypothetical protein
VGDLEWLVKLLPQGTAVTAVVAVVSLILLKYVPTLIKEFRDTIQGIVASHAQSLKEEREVFRGEMKEQRETFSRALKETAEAFASRTEAIAGRIDTLTDSHRGLQGEVHDLRTQLLAREG